MFDQSFGAALFVPTGLPASVNCPFVAWCWRYVIMKKRDDEEGEHLHSWLPEEHITAAYYYIKQLGGPKAPTLWEMLSQWWHSMVMTIDSSRLRACCMFEMMSQHKLQWETLMKRSAMNYKLRGQRGKTQHWGRDGPESFNNDTNDTSGVSNPNKSAMAAIIDSFMYQCKWPMYQTTVWINVTVWKGCS